MDAPRRSLLDLLLGRRLASSEAGKEQIGPLQGISVLGLDALSSAAYGPEAALTVLLPLGLAGTAWLAPLLAAVVAVLAVLTLSYRQTIDAYPGGGGSYTVARTNLGARAGLCAAAALLVDYLLNAAVGTSAGVSALVSAFPPLAAHRLAATLAVLGTIALLNLRGLREAGALFSAPTYLFVATAFAVLGLGAWRALAGGGAVAVVPPPAPSTAIAAATPWLLARAFASGCTAMTGVEAVSNAVPAFRAPSTTNARRTLAAIAILLAVLLVGIAIECRLYGVAATPPAGPRYESVLSQLAGAVAGRGVLYDAFMACTFAVLALSVNTSFAGFPRLCALLARDGLLPHGFRHRGRRLGFTAGVLVLWGVASLLLVVFDGVTDRLIPLFAVGAFTAFTFSQTGMVARWLRRRDAGGLRGAAATGLGALATGASLVVIVAAKFTQGAWISALAIPGLALSLRWFGRRREAARRAVALHGPMVLGGVAPPVALVPIIELDRAAEHALRFALTVSPEVRAVHLRGVDGDRDHVARRFEEWVAEPARRARLPVPRLDIVASPYRETVEPLAEHVRKVQAEHPGRAVAVVIPEVLHASRSARWMTDGAALVSELLVLDCGERVAIVRVPWEPAEK